MEEKNQKEKYNSLKKRISDYVFNNIKNKMPKISETEQEAIDAGDTWIDADIFKGDVDWKYILELEENKLSKKELDFIDKKVKPLLEKINNEQIKKDNDLNKTTWNHLKKEKFFAMIIPEEYGGLGFSPHANSTIVCMLASVSSTLAVTVMVPNSLGPAELLLKYGTEEQKEYYLPNLAKGKDIPCFALTSPIAGSDAGAITDTGIIKKKNIDDKEVIGIELNFSKRYITLAPVATLMGLAFKLYDPDNIIGEKKNYGITVALISTDTKGINNDYRHQPMQLSFMNGTITGENVFIPLDYIIGGVENAGKGWRMLVECLSAGRGISLPALSGAISQNNVRIATSYSLIREQFNVPIYEFEGIQESLMKIIAFNNIINATRKLTNKSLNIGKHPSVITAITKYHTTEMARESVKETMDILGGKAIIQGKGNPLSDPYSGMPVAITVEGANILTRYLMIFGQGSMRCHPYLLEEIKLLNSDNEERAKKEFYHVFYKHITETTKNSFSSFISGLTFDLVSATPSNTPYKSHIKKINHYTNALSSISDITLLKLGGKLKYKEYLSSRLGDILSNLYMSCAIIYAGNNVLDKKAINLNKWCLDYLLSKCDEAFNDFIQNFEGDFLSNFMRFYNFPFGIQNKKPTIKRSRNIINDVIYNIDFRENMVKESYYEGKHNPILDFEKAYRFKIKLLKDVDFDKIKEFQKNNKDLVDGLNKHEFYNILLEKDIINEEEQKKLNDYIDLSMKVINVDSFKHN